MVTIMRNISRIGFFEKMVSSQRSILGKKNQGRIRHARIALIGIGGNGSPAAEMLVRLGCENLVLADPDCVEASNLSRQKFTKRDIGSLKVRALKKWLVAINPGARIEIHEKGFIEENANAILKHAIVAIDSADNYMAKILLSRVGRMVGIPVVHNSGAADRGSVTTFLPTGISYENLFNLPSKGRPYGSFDPTIFIKYRYSVAKYLYKNLLPARVIKKISIGKISFPMTGFATTCAGVIAAREAIKIVLGQRKKAIIAPRILQFDLLNNRFVVIDLIKQKEKSLW